MKRTELHRLVDQLPDDAVNRAGILLKQVAEWQPDLDQAWFWAPEWFEGELEADAEVRAGGGAVYDSDAAFLLALRAVRRM